jgi:hypothetical protein
MAARTTPILGTVIVVTLVLTGAPASAETLTFTTIADSYVSKGAPSRNFGTATTLRVRDPGVKTHLKFQVSGIPADQSVETATVRLFSPTGDTCSTVGIGTDLYRAASDAWTETGITFNNAPGKTGGRLATADGFRSGSYVEFNVTGVVTGNGTLGLFLEMPACSTDSAPTKFNSKEATSNRPQLVLTTTGGDPSPPPQCADRIDNDSDGKVDFPADPGCSSSEDNDEADPVGGGGDVVAAAGDIACDPNATYFDGSNPSLCQHRRTANLLSDATAVLALGDLQYNVGSLAKFLAAYDPSWGQYVSKTYPVPGNHEYRDPAGGAQGYFDYWSSKGRPTGGAGAGYYSWNLNSWHMIALNSSDGLNGSDIPCQVGPSCAEGSPQNDWLEQDLASVSASSCILAYWHHPLFNSGVNNGNDDTSPVRELWTDLYAAGADIILNGHEHNYQLYAPMTPQGVPSSDGIRQFISGGGGKSLNSFLTTKDPGFEFGAKKHGVLKLELASASYSWKFVDVAGTVVNSGGPVACHN